MKEVYFDPGSVSDQAEHMIRELYPRGQKRAGEFSPERAALLVLDLQRYFLDPASHAFVPSAVPFLPRINQLIELFRNRSRPVIFTRHTNTPGNAGNMASWWRELLTADHPLHGLDSRLDWEDSQILAKSQYDAFYQTPLETILQEAGVQQVVVSGVMTHLCCETTARSAFMRGYEVFFLVDCTASYSREFHLGALRSLGHGFAALTTSKRIEAGFQGVIHG